MTLRDKLLAFAVLASFSLALSGASEKRSDQPTLPLLVPHEKFSKDCGQCHVSNDWVTLRPDFSFDHKKETGYPLNGAHAKTKCTACHTDRGSVKQFSIRGCAGCHADPHKSAMGLNCTRCHTEITWRPNDLIVKHAEAGFPLTGAHLGTLCERCHTRAPVGDYRGATPICYTCHLTDYSRAPNHAAMNFSRSCNECHSTTSFMPARFNHAFLGNVSNCYSCHAADYAQAPNHAAFSYPTTCGDCHNTNSFVGASFTHSFLGSNPNCYSCHAVDYLQAHGSDQAGHPIAQCGSCHNTNSWNP